MSPTRYAARTVINCVTILCLIFLARGIIHFMNPMLTNDLAMTQMDNSDTYVVVMGIYNTVKPIVKIVFTIIIGGFAGMICRDTYEFVKNFTTEFEKEN